MIFQNSPVLDGNEKKYVLDCLDTNWISSMGQYIGQFEEAFAKVCGVAHGVSCSNGTTALHLALKGLGIGHGDEVIVPDFTLIADSNMVILAGAKPVFVDVLPTTWCIDPAKIEEAITGRTRAILAVHMYGHPCEMGTISEIARRHNLFVIEDAAQAHGSKYRGRPAGSLSDIACFSFYGSKTLTTGEGGMVITNSDDYATKLRLMRSHGFEGSGRTYVHNVMGYNYRMTNMQAAVGLAQTERLAEKAKRKREIAASYKRLLSDTNGITFQVENGDVEAVVWNFTVLLDEGFGKNRDEVAAYLEKNDIQTRLTFKPLHAQPVYQNASISAYPDTTGHFPVSERLGRSGLCLPSGLDLSEKEIELVCSTLIKSRKFA